MRKTRVWITLGCCFAAPAIIVNAQNGKAGLWEVASRTTFQQSGSVGMFNATQPANSPSDAAPGLPVCLSQEVVDKFGVVLPPSLRDCELSHVVRQPNHMSADLTCSGRTNGKGSIDSAWTDEDHVQGKIHFVGKAKHGPNNTITMTWTEDSNAVFKNTDCGSVRPRTIPAKTQAVNRLPASK